MLLNFWNNINAVLLTDHVFPNDIEAFLIEKKVNTCRWLICCLFNPNEINVSTICSKKYNNVLLMGDYYVDVKQTNMKVFFAKKNKLWTKKLLASKILIIYHVFPSSLQIAQRSSKNP